MSECKACDFIKKLTKSFAGEEPLETKDSTRTGLKKSKSSNCVEVIVISKETGRKLEGILCDVEDGVKFKPNPIKLNVEKRSSCEGLSL